MIGQEYFDVRSRVGTVLYALSALVEEAGIDPDHKVILRNLLTSLNDPFVFVVAGEVNVGKSTFLNTLFRGEFSPTGVIPTTDKIYFFKHGPELRHVAISQSLEEVYVPSDLLKDFHLVDTPGTNSLDPEHQEITERFVPVADLVIFVFSAANPWGASTWQFLDRVHRHWMRHVIFVLQQSDLRTPSETETIVKHMRQLSLERFEHEIPIFPVSAKTANLARERDFEEGSSLRARSGFDELEHYISHSIGASGARLGKLDQALQIARKVLSAMQQATGIIPGAEEKSALAFQQMAEQLDAHQKRTFEKVTPALETANADFVWITGDLLRYLKNELRGLATFASLFTEKRKVFGLDQMFQDEASKALLPRWKQSAAILEDDLHIAANELETFELQQVSETSRDDVLTDERNPKDHENFVAEGLEKLQKLANEIALEDVLAPALKTSRRLAWSMVMVVLLAACSATVWGMARRWDLCVLYGGVGFFLAFGFWSRGRRTVREAHETVEHRLTQASAQLKTSLQNQIKDRLDRLYGRLSGRLLALRNQHEKAQAQRSFLHEQLHQLSGNFAELEARLRSLTSSETRLSR